MIRAVMFDFGGVITTSPFDAFEQYEQSEGLPVGLIRQLNSTNPDTNAWSQLERGSVDVTTFARAFEIEALDLGHRVDGRRVLSLLGGQIRPAMVEAVRLCGTRFQTACLTNNFATEDDGPRPEVAAVLELFDVLLESRALGIRKPEKRFYELGCEALDVRPDEVVYLDDLGVNLKPARAMGMHTIKVTEPDTALAELSVLVGLDLTS